MASKSKEGKIFQKSAGNGPQTDDKTVKVEKWDGAAIKNALDDAAKQVLVDRFGYLESHKLMDGRLLICTVAVAFALGALVYDYLHPFPESRPILILCVVSYFIMMCILTVYTTYMERGNFLVALEKDIAGTDPDNTWRMASQLKRYDDVYHLYVSYTDGITKETRSAEFNRSVAAFFDENGCVCFDIFEPEVYKLHSSVSREKKVN